MLKAFGRWLLAVVWPVLVLGGWASFWWMVAVSGCRP